MIRKFPARSCARISCSLMLVVCFVAAQYSVAADAATQVQLNAAKAAPRAISWSGVMPHLLVSKEVI